MTLDGSRDRGDDRHRLGTSEQIAQRLLDLRAERAAELTELTASLTSIRAARSDGTADDEHDPEGSTLSSDWSRLAGQRAELDEKDAAVDQALERLAGGTYGTCIRCARVSGTDRLLARPAASTCIECARELEQRRR